MMMLKELDFNLDKVIQACADIKLVKEDKKIEAKRGDLL